MTQFNFAAQPAAKSCRLIDFEEAKIFPGILPDTWFLTVKGTKPCLNMEVSLAPLVYIQCPDYWGIEVVGCLPHGVCLPAVGRFDVTIPLAGITGYKGIEVAGATKNHKSEVSGGCKQPTKS